MSKATLRTERQVLKPRPIIIARAMLPNKDPSHSPQPNPNANHAALQTMA